MQHESDSTERLAMQRFNLLKCAIVFVNAIVGFPTLDAQTEVKSVAISSTSGLQPNLAGQVGRPLRYRPENGEFLIENGGEFFNRSLYGGNTAFRVDGGDEPEFTLYLPGRGGNLRLGVSAGGQTKWLKDASHITTRYRQES